MNRYRIHHPYHLTGTGQVEYDSTCHVLDDGTKRLTTFADCRIIWASSPYDALRQYCQEMAPVVGIEERYAVGPKKGKAKIHGWRIAKDGLSASCPSDWTLTPRLGNGVLLQSAVKGVSNPFCHNDRGHNPFIPTPLNAIGKRSRSVVYDGTGRWTDKGENKPADGEKDARHVDNGRFVMSEKDLTTRPDLQIPVKPIETPFHGKLDPQRRVGKSNANWRSAY